MVPLKAGVDVGASTLVWSTWWIREKNGVGVSIQECEEGLEDRRNEQCPPRKDKGAFPCHMLVREGCFIFRGFGRSGIGEESTRRKNGKGKRKICRYNQKSQAHL